MPYRFFFLPRAAPAAYGGSQARGQIGAVAASLTMQDSSHVFELHHSSQQHQIFSLLSGGQGLNPYPHGHQLDLFLLSHDGNSPCRGS